MIYKCQFQSELVRDSESTNYNFCIDIDYNLLKSSSLTSTRMSSSKWKLFLSLLQTRKALLEIESAPLVLCAFMAGSPSSSPSVTKSSPENSAAILAKNSLETQCISCHCQSHNGRSLQRRLQRVTHNFPALTIKGIKTNLSGRDKEE